MLWKNTAIYWLCYWLWLRREVYFGLRWTCTTFHNLHLCPTCFLYPLDAFKFSLLDAKYFGTHLKSPCVLLNVAEITDTCTQGAVRYHWSCGFHNSCEAQQTIPCLVVWLFSFNYKFSAISLLVFTLKNWLYFMISSTYININTHRTCWKC